MIVDTRISLRADVLPPRARRAKKAFVFEQITTHLNEVPAWEAPVAIRILDRDGTRCDVRYHEGHLFRAAGAGAGRDGAYLGVEESIMKFLEAAHLHVRHPEGSGHSRSQKLKGKVLSSHADAISSIAQEWADRNCLVVDGIAHVRARSPLVDLLDVIVGFGGDIALECGRRTLFPAWFARMPLSGASIHRFLAGRRMEDGGSRERGEGARPPRCGNGTTRPD